MAGMKCTVGAPSRARPPSWGSPNPLLAPGAYLRLPAAKEENKRNAVKFQAGGLKVFLGSSRGLFWGIWDLFFHSFDIRMYILGAPSPPIAAVVCGKGMRAQMSCFEDIVCRRHSKCPALACERSALLALQSCRQAFGGRRSVSADGPCSTGL